MAIWCVVANVAEEWPAGPGGETIRRGTKHFVPGARVFCFPPLWGDGYENVKVVGRHRGSHRYVTMVVPARALTHWRVHLVYSPHVIAQMTPHWDDSRASREKAESLMAWLQAGRPPTLPARGLRALLRRLRDRLLGG